MKKFNFLVFIDDDSFTNIFHEIVLKEANICEEYMFFDSAQEALDFFNEEYQKDTPRVPEYIFLDINMPEINGWQFLDKYTNEQKQQVATIIMLTTSISIQDKKKSETYQSIEAFTNKPLTVEFLQSL